ncbi:MAG: Eco57I restriction-modification methylase domain-containing protein, partial [Bacteroidia bacterium]|nr:Eco57I restriction-modification methylase domain-containing protein [Bacteroidia bacterium]
RDAVAKGRFDKFVQNDTFKKGTQTLDKDFVASLDEWRVYLAKSIVLSNKKINEEELNYAVQQIIDRLIFLRFCEDRAVEQYGQLQKAVMTKGSSYNHLIDVFKQADDKYNPGLFDFKKDTITPSLKVPDKVIKHIISELYFPVCQYEFSVMPVEILGNAYEQFLGKVIRITAGHSARIEQKPEVRKAGGVFYTPQYIVEYIIKNTVGKLIDGKSPKEIAQLKIVDPACGSGSFLLGAFQYILNYHANWYIQKGYLNKKDKNNPLSPTGVLTTIEKKRILVNNIFGVDIDSNAVEVSKLSLLLKCMEGETAASIKQQLSVFHDRVLPDLDNNIKCGNSLIDFDDELNFGGEKKLKPFNWKRAFPEVFKHKPTRNDTIKSELKAHYNKVKSQSVASDDLLSKLTDTVEEPAMEYGLNGGFDVVIGNPPYVRQELLGDYKEYFEKHYRVFHGMADLYSYFIEKGKALLRHDGYFGIIVANKWMRANYGEPLRKWLKQINITEITDFGDLPVFDGATTYPCILIYRNSMPVKHFKVANVKTLQFSNLGNHVEELQTIVNQENLSNEGWSLTSEAEQNLLNKIKSKGIPLGKYVNEKIYRGVLTGLNEAFVIDNETRKRLIKDDEKCAEIIKPFLTGRDIKRYQYPQSDKFLIFFPKGFTNHRSNSTKSPWKWIQETYPSVATYLKPFETSGKKRTDMGDYWWELRACDYYDEFEKPKIIYQVFQVTPCFIWDTKGHFCNNAIWIIPKNDKYLLAILNSPLGWYLISQYCTQIQNGFQLIYKYLEKIPIHSIDFAAQNERIKHDEILKDVDLLLKLNEELKITKLQLSVGQLKQQIAHAENKINQLVYELYELTPEEIAVIENSNKD